MKSPLLLSAALALLLPALPVATVQAQVDLGPSNTRASAKRNAARAKQAPANSEAAALYPGASRQSPSQLGEKALAKDMEALIGLQEKDGAEDEVIAMADRILANPKANAFDKSSAAYMAGAAWQTKESSGFANASKYYRLALEHNGLHNNNHYRAMLQLAQMLEADEKGAEALVMVDRFLTETKSVDSNAWAIKAQVLLSQDRPKEAAAALEKILANKPDDKKTMLNLASVYIEAEENAKAGAIFDKLRAAGLLTESKDYERAFRLLANIEGRERDAMAVIDEGLKKGVLQPSYDMYSFQGSTYYAADDFDGAIAAWSKGAPLSRDGEMYLNVAKLLLDKDKFAEAKAAAASAREKGVRRPGDTWSVQARAENSLGNVAASKAALQQATKYPETRKWAEAALRQGLAK